MRIRILAWQYENIRRMQDLSVSLTKEDGTVYSSALIMMPNGTGKTTTLQLIRAVLSGNATEWNARKVRSYRPANAGVLEGKFILKMQYDQDIYYHILRLDYDAGKAAYETSTAMMEGGYESGWRMPLSLNGIFQNEQLINRFIFDGEQARKTLDSNSQEAESALVHLYQLERLERLSRLISKMEQEYQQQSVGGGTERSVQVYKGKADRKRQRYQGLLEEQQRLKKQLEQMENERKDYEKKYLEILTQDNRLRTEQERLTKEQIKNQENRNRTLNALMTCIRKPYNIQLDYHTRLKSLAENMQVLKLPKNTAQEFFRELAESKICLCGRCIGQEEKRIILSKAEEYLGENSLIVVNAIKRALNEYEREDTCDGLEKDLRELMEKEMQIGLAMERLAVQMADEGNQEILRVQEKMKKLEHKMPEIERMLERLTTTDYITNTGLNEENNIPKARAAKEEAEVTFQKACGTFEFIQKAERMNDYIGRVRNNALNRLKNYVIQSANKKIEELIVNDTISIKRIDGHLILNGKDGASEGQTLAVAYAYIGTLFEHSHFEFPFFVDSPAAPMDLNVRREVARILPKLFEQTVILVTSGEKRGFSDMFYRQKDVLYLTLKGEKDEAVECIPGREYFEQYQEREE